MKIFAIKDETDVTGKKLAWLLYYEAGKKFFIELPEDADEWETPLLLSSFAKRGEFTLDSFWSKLWVQQRIVPLDRQNLGQIFKENNIKEYDEFQLLLMSQGRCAQDHYYLKQTCMEELPKEILKRFERKVEDVIPLTENNLLVFFHNQVVKKVNVQKLLKNGSDFLCNAQNTTLFQTVSIEAGGYGVCWGETFRIADSVLYHAGTTVPLSMNDFRSFVKNRVVNTAEAAEIIHCTRQNIDDLIHRGKLTPIKVTPKNKLFLKSELTQRKWQ